MKNVFLKKSVVFVMMAVLALSVAMPVYAVNLWGNSENDVNTALGMGNKDPRAIAASVINIMLGFLGIIAVVIILLGGFKWMTGGGNEDKVGEAKKLMIAGVVGLIIILASWGLANFVLNSLLESTGANTNA